jgi:hypothetical protein
MANSWERLFRVGFCNKMCVEETGKSLKRGWKVLVTLEVIEWSAALSAIIQRLAGCRPELAL